MDVLDELVSHILGAIRQTFKYHTSTIYEGMGDVIVANIDILGTLVSHYKYPTSVEIDEISQWKAEYLQVYDHFVTNNVLEDTREDQKDYFLKRREIIVNTFDRLYRIIKLVRDDEDDE